MNIKSVLLEKICLNLKIHFSNYFDWENIDLSYLHVDIINKKIYILSSNYDWQLMCCDDDLDLMISERLTSGIKYWNSYSQSYLKALSKTEKNKLKIDFFIKYSNIFEITSINSKKQISVRDMMNIYKYRPTIADYAHRIWKQDPEIALPLRADVSLPSDVLKNTENKSSELLDIHQYMRFGNIRFTRKEIITIRLLLSHCRVKEISAIQGCSEASEHKRIQRIKEKLDCPYASPSGLFKVLKEHGITLACLETLVSFP